MADRFRRAELHELVWAEPMRTLAKRFGISDVALKKVCTKAHVPAPPRGYWARKQAGKKTWVIPLPPRPAGMVDEFDIPARNAYAYRGWSDAEILGPLPDPPTFDDPIESVRERVRKQIGRVAVARGLSNLHVAIAEVLREDELRAEKQASALVSFPWQEPVFTTPLARRRLRILNALFLATARAGGKGYINEREHESVGISVHQQHVAIKLSEAPKKRRRSGAGELPKREKPALRLSVLYGHGANTERASWEDDDTVLEARIAQIAVEVIVAAELQHREHCVRLHEWRIEQKAELEAERRRQEAEVERKRREREAALAKERVDHLLARAKARSDACAIRAYVEAVCSAPVAASTDAGALEGWRAWALQQADQLDPVTSGAFLTDLRLAGGQPPEGPSS